MLMSDASTLLGDISVLTRTRKWYGKVRGREINGGVAGSYKDGTASTRMD